MIPRPISSIIVGLRHRKELGDIAALAKSIADVGLLHPIVIRTDGTLIAGERRLAACRHLGWTEIPITAIDLDQLVFGEQAENIDRKDFTPEERVSIGEAIETLVGQRKGQRTDIEPSRNLGEVIKGRTDDFVAKKAGFKNADTYRQAKEVVEAGGKPLADMNRTGRVNGPYKRVKVAKQSAVIRAEAPPLPSKGPYRVIIADPPWPYELRKADPSHRATHPYPQMSIEQICAVPVMAMAHPDCLLWLWTTNHHMRQAFSVLDAWGFAEKTILTWAKDRMGTGDWLRGQSEHCIMAVRGRPTVHMTNQTTILRGPLRANSQKPIEFYEFIEKLCPAPRYAYLFSRYQHNDKWDCHGDEAVNVAAA